MVKQGAAEGLTDERASPDWLPARIMNKLRKYSGHMPEEAMCDSPQHNLRLTFKVSRRSIKCRYLRSTIFFVIDVPLERTV